MQYNPHIIAMFKQKNSRRESAVFYAFLNCLKILIPSFTINGISESKITVAQLPNVSGTSEKSVHKGERVTRSNIAIKMPIARYAVLLERRE